MDTQAVRDLRDALHQQIQRVIVGQTQALDLMLLGLFCQGHVLLEGVPGTAKTLMARAFASCLSLEFGRIQFTPDLMPGDVLGTNLFDFRSNTFTLTKGPIFTDLLLADEINRTPPKTQAALLEAMQEKRISSGGVDYALDKPFFVLATQNPIEQEGTYPLPEAQVDRFMLKVKITYPEADEERKVLDLALDETARPVQPVLTAENIAAMQEVVKMIYIDDQVKSYILDVVRATRSPADFSGRQMHDLEPLIDFGASPRASIYLGLGARAVAFLAGRGYVTPQDVKDVAYDVLRHRVILTYEAEAEQRTPEDVIETILTSVPVP